mmetsp:Transcript_5998/g.11197  ORF Transcript_5998/g.11197 Transcript_5998/m.11197 type:complete len:89 (+) Transcript_5998:375-641(+)
MCFLWTEEVGQTVPARGKGSGGISSISLGLPFLVRVYLAFHNDSGEEGMEWSKEKLYMTGLLFSIAPHCVACKAQILTNWTKLSGSCE